MFKRRHPRSRWAKLKEASWPSMGVKRLLLYYRHRLGRLPGTPHSIATGIASGVAVSITPFFGFHLIMGTFLCWMLRGSFVAMVLASFAAGNPWTYPFIWVGTYKLGHLLLGHAARASAGRIRIPESFTFELLLRKPTELLWPMALGSLPFALLAWGIAFYVSRAVVRRYKEARLARLHKRRTTLS